MMNIKNCIFLFLFLCCPLGSVAQCVYSMLTNHEGYWLLYSERIEQCQNGDCIAKETFTNDEMLDAIMFDTDGILHSVTTMNGFSQSESQWKVNNENILTLFDENGTMQLEIIEVSASRLVLKYSEERPGGLYMAKISTYCFPDTRLSEEEADLLNERGVFEIETLTVRSENVIR